MDWANALYGALQHHGMPTPLLDVTSSIDIAAFFAFSDKQCGDRNARFFLFDRADWETDGYFAERLPVSLFKLVPARFEDLGNERCIRQMGSYLITNVSNIDGFICREEQRNQRKMVTRIDVPWSEADMVRSFLEEKGINKESLFPHMNIDRGEIKNLESFCNLMKNDYF
jgi:hypothetical protein